MAKKQITTKQFFKLLSKASREEDVILAYRDLLGADKWPRPFGCDGLHDDILFEVKLDVNLTAQAGWEGVAQAAYYLRRLVNEGIYKGEHYIPPKMIVVCDRNQAISFDASKLEPFIKRNFKWNRPASSPDPSLVIELRREFNKLVVYDMTTEAGVEIFRGTLAGGGSILQTITRDNFDKIFEVWRGYFAADSEPQAAAQAFILDLEGRGARVPDQGLLILRSDGAEDGSIHHFEFRISIPMYDQFWASYRRPPTTKEMRAIIERKDRLVVMQLRRTTGEFFTPLDYARLAHEYLRRAIPNRYDEDAPHHSMYDDYNWWDPCCGTGNLTYHCPSGMKGELFMSTLNQEDIDVIHHSHQNRGATIFQYDFLNQDDDELPAKLRRALKNGKPWIFILNPPFAAANDMSVTVGAKGNLKPKVADNKISGEMDGMDAAKRNLTGQFMFRLMNLISGHGLRANIGMFSTANVWTGMGFSTLRDKWLSSAGFSAGFCFPSVKFMGTKGHWPILFTTWSPDINDINIVADVIEDIIGDTEVIVGEKDFVPAVNPLSRWVTRPSAKVVLPPMNGALGVVQDQSSTTDRMPVIHLDKLPDGGIGHLQMVANDVLQSKSIPYLTSGPNASGQGWGLTPDNFHDSIVCLATRKLVIPMWLNDRDEFSAPDLTHPGYDQWAIDAIVWSLFHGANQTSSLGKVAYKGQVYDIPNHFFWMTPEEMLNIPGLPLRIASQCEEAAPRFVSTWLAERADQFSADARQLLDLGRELVRISGPHRMKPIPKFQLERWDAGWYQIRMGLFAGESWQPQEMTDLMTKFKAEHKLLGDRLRPMIYELGFLPRERTLAELDQETQGDTAQEEVS